MLVVLPGERITCVTYKREEQRKVTKLFFLNGVSTRGELQHVLVVVDIDNAMKTGKV